jgi:hypothetical protein
LQHDLAVATRNTDDLERRGGGPLLLAGPVAPQPHVVNNDD